MEIPYQKLAPETLNKMIKEFILREGTEYGETEYTIEQKINQVKKQLYSKQISIYFDHEDETFTIKHVNEVCNS